jgi:long-chain fatty acid transport protein
MWSPTGDLRVGLSINAPFGLVTQYDSGFIGRYHALKSDLQTVDVALNAAYRLHPKLSLGASLIYRRVDAELSNAVDFGSILAAIGQPVLPGSADGQATIKGDAAVLGFKAGLVFRPTPELSLGIAYHGSTRPKVEGTVRYDYPSPAIGAAMADPRARLVDGSVEATVDLPDSISLGLSWDLHPSFNLAFEASRTGWSTFKELRMKFGSGQGDSVTREDWRDTWFCSLGATWRLSKALSLRAGIATDQGAAPDGTRTPRIPDGDRTWFSAGLGWTLSRNLGVDLACTHIAMKDAPMALSAGTAGGPDFFRGSLGGTFRDSIDILALSTRIRF